MIRNQPSSMNRKSFTLIELLVVLALVAILSVVVILTLNPAELLKQARDSNRLSDLTTINTALNLFSADVIGGFMGTSTVVYVSIPSTTSTCSNLGLPTLPTGYTYNCVTSQNLRNTDGTGWIPVNFGRISSNSPIPQLPIDPTNTTSTRLYYTYTPGGSWELNASIEASKNKLGGSNDLVSKDGGSATSLYEIGTNLNLNPIETGDSSLVGYWNFEEGSGATVYDRSGNGNNMFRNGTSTTRYSIGKAGSYSGYFNGSYEHATGTVATTTTSQFTMSFWFNWNGTSTANQIIFYNGYSASNGYGCYLNYSDSFRFRCLAGGMGFIDTSVAFIPTVGHWYNIVLVRNSTWYVYINGIVKGTASSSLNPGAPLGAASIGGEIKQAIFNGSIDEARIYNRALSEAEILTQYNLTK